MAEKLFAERVISDTRQPGSRGAQGQESCRHIELGAPDAGKKARKLRWLARGVGEEYHHPFAKTADGGSDYASRLVALRQLRPVLHIVQWMITVNATLDRIRAQRVVAVVRSSRLDEPERLVAALARGGIDSVEFTFTTPGIEVALQRCAAAGLAVGAGTVLDESSALTALEAGASFLMTPCVISGILELASPRGVPVIMGAFSPTEVRAAAVAGASMVKIFPASTGGPRHFSNLRGPFPDVELLASGGLDQTNAADYLRAALPPSPLARVL